MEDSIYKFKVKDIDGNEVSLEDYKGKVYFIQYIISTQSTLLNYLGLLNS